MTTHRADPYARLGPRPTPVADYTSEHTYQSTRLPVDLATTLIPDAYTTQEFFDLERERVFASSWVAVACTSDVDRPGRVVVVDVAGRSVIVTRNREGALRAFHNVCRHRATKLLTDGQERLKRIRCPYHSWTYDLDGRCLGTPLFEGSDIPPDQRGAFDMSDVQGFDRADYGLLPVRADSWGFLVFVNLDPNASPLSRQLGDLPERFSAYHLDEWRAVRRTEYGVEANYKLVGENFMEYYHLPWVHPELIQVSKLADHYRWQGAGMYTGMCTTPVSRNSNAGGWEGLPPMGSLGAEDANSGRFVWLFPSTAITVLPNHAFVLFSRPDGPARTVEEAVLLVPPGTGDGPGTEAGLDQLAGFWDLVNRQDLEIVARVQAGLANPAYRGGRMCYRFEEPLHRFQNMVIDRMLGLDRVPAGDDVAMTPMLAADP